MTFEEWKKSSIKPNLIISTIRNNQATFNESNPLPSTSDAMVMDFSWPLSIDKSGVSKKSRTVWDGTLIRVAHRLGVEWDYTSTIKQSELLITDIQKKFMSALTDRSLRQIPFLYVPNSRSDV